MPAGSAELFVGIDAGTSQCRACAIDTGGTELALVATAMPAPRQCDGRIEQAPNEWWDAAVRAFDDLFGRIDAGRVGAIAVAGTSGTILLAHGAGSPLTPALMYNDQSSRKQAARIERVAPEDSAARGTGSALARMLQLLERTHGATPAFALHQADWIAARLCGACGITDENNALKLGYDCTARRWPAWITGLGIDPALLPRVVPAGTAIGFVDTAIAQRFGLRRRVRIVAGTTDSVAAALAAGIASTGDAVTSLGSTMGLKIVAERPLASAAHGIYTHRLREAWLAGGASNTGGAVLASLFTAADLMRLSAQIDADQPSPLDYYPLLRPGERFPDNDPALAPRLAPRPASDVEFLHGLFESMARIEARGYRLREQLGAPFPRQVATAGGGAANPAWRRIRQRVLGVPVTVAAHAEASYGAALLARDGARA